MASKFPNEDAQPGSATNSAIGTNDEEIDISLNKQVEQSVSVQESTNPIERVDLELLGTRTTEDPEQETNRSKPTKPTELPMRKSERIQNLAEKQQLMDSLKQEIKTLSDNHMLIVQELGKPCSLDRLNELHKYFKTNLDTINAQYDELKVKLMSCDDKMEVLKSIDRVTRDRNLLRDQIVLLLETAVVRPKTNKPHSTKNPVVDNDDPVSVRSKDRSAKTPSTRKSSSSRQSSRISGHSSAYRYKVNESAANVAAKEAELEGKMEALKIEQEIARMEHENKLQIERKKQELAQKRLKAEIEAEKRKQEVYQQALEEEEAEDSRDMLMLPPRRATRLLSAEVKSLGVPPPPQGKMAQPARIQPNALQLRLPEKIPSSPLSNNVDLTFTTSLAKSIAEAMKITKLPPVEPPVFHGDPLQYGDWIASFSALVDSKPLPALDKLHYLKKFTGSKARETISGYFQLRSADAYTDARKMLEKRFGNPYIIATAFRSKLDSWPKIGVRDNTGMRKFSDFLHQCETAMISIPELNILNDCSENQKLLVKLPERLCTRWIDIVAKKREQGGFPAFSEFSRFVYKESEKMNDPILTYKDVNVIKTEKVEKSRALASHVAQQEHPPRSQQCLACNKDNHATSECFWLARRTADEKNEFCRKNGLCFGCLRPGHMTKQCKNRSTCKKCAKKHPTCMHLGDSDQLNEMSTNDNTTEKTQTDTKTSNAFCGELSSTGGKPSSLTSMILPVWVSNSNGTNTEEHLVYAMLDTQSDTTFVLGQTAEKLDADYNQVRLTLSTMTTQGKQIHCRKYRNLTIRGFKQTTTIELPPAYSREYIPAKRDHIPVPQSAMNWPHLSRLASEIPELQDCEIGLLIGYNCPQAFEPEDKVPGKNGEPFAIRTPLGWAIIGPTTRMEDSGDVFGMSHRIETKAVEPVASSGTDCQPSRSHVQFKYSRKVKEEVTAYPPDKILSLLEQDFKDEHHCLSKVGMSVDDRTFMNTLQKTAHRDQEGNVTMGLPMKAKPPPNGSHQVAKHRLALLERKFRRDAKDECEYRAFTNGVLQSFEAESVDDTEPTECSPQYIPHFGVYHPRPPDKIRVVSACAAKVNGTCLNEYLLQGPDFMNSLVRVLMRFGHEHVAFMFDIERMLHRFRMASQNLKLSVLRPPPKPPPGDIEDDDVYSRNSG